MEIGALQMKCGRKDRDLDDCLDNCDKKGLTGKALKDCYCECWEKYPSTSRTKSKEDLIDEWEKSTGQEWPKDPETGARQSPNHVWPLADGGRDNGKFVDPVTRQQHIDLHKNNGDFSRWAKRKGRTCK
jgi:hypothetical protein